MFVIKQVIETREEFNCPLYLLFLDFEKAYDRVKRQNLWEILMHLQVPNNLINAIKSLYETTLIKIKADHGKTT